MVNTRTSRWWRLAGIALSALALLSGCGGGDGGSAAPAQAQATRPASLPAQAAVTHYPFGARLDAYATTMRVSGTPATLDQQIHQWYANWASARLQTTPYGVINKGGNCYATSESTGYGMLITVVMAGDPRGDLDAKGKFDGLLATAIHDRATSTPASYVFTDPAPAPGTAAQQLKAQDYLMAWCLDSTGATLYDPADPASPAYNAVDGDLDIALALLMADRQWGSNGIDGSPQNYRQRALRTIKAIQAFNTDAAGNILSKGPAFPGTTRSSDLMIGHFRAFRQATGDAFWDAVVDRAFQQIGMMQPYAQTAAGMPTGLMPDWIQNADTSAARPWTGASPEGGNPYAGIYGGNAQRDPWRFASDYVFSNDGRWTASTGALARVAQFFSTAWNNTPRPATRNTTDYNTGIYDLNGTLVNAYLSQAVGGAVMASAIVSPQYQPLLDNTWNWLHNVWPTADYYESDVALLSMFVVSGNWWRPDASGGNTGGGDPGSGGIAQTVHVEAEAGAVQGSGVAVRNDLAGFTGSGFVGSFTSASDSLTLSFPNVVAASYDVKIRYHAWTAQQNNVTINGVTRQDVAFPASTPTTSDWVFATIPGVALPAGTTTVTIQPGWGYIDVDYVELVPAGTGGSGGGSGTVTAEAEAGTVQGTGVRVRSDLAGYSGSGFVGDFSGTGDALTVHLDGLAPGSYTLTIRYHAWTAQQNTVTVNGAARTVSFPASTPTTSDWVTVAIPNVTLGSSNTVVIGKDWGYIDVDWIRAGPG